LTVEYVQCGTTGVAVADAFVGRLVGKAVGLDVDDGDLGGILAVG
jgi:hypothetical protein